MRKILFFLALIIFFFIINNLIHSIHDLWEKKDLLIVVEKELESEKAKNKELKKQLSIVNSNEFIEQEARNKLFLVMPGEQEVLMTEEDRIKKNSSKTENLPNWRKWWNLFF